MPGLAALAGACRRHGAEVVVDAYHALGVMALPVRELGVADAWVVGGGYKYLQLGEGNAFLRLPAHADRIRPVVTGWFAEFAELTEAERTPAASGTRPAASAFAGATYDPTSHYRAARVGAVLRRPAADARLSCGRATGTSGPCSPTRSTPSTCPTTWSPATGTRRPRRSAGSWPCDRHGPGDLPRDVARRAAS